jgi:hypothetical protein
MEQADIDAIKILVAASEQIQDEMDAEDQLYGISSLFRIRAGSRLAHAIRYLRNGHVHHSKNRTYRSR